MTAQPTDPADKVVFLAKRRRARDAAVDGLVVVDDATTDAETDAVVPAVAGAPVDRSAERSTVYATITGLSTAGRPPIIAAWLRNSAQRRHVAKLAVNHGLYLLGLHTTKTFTRYLPYGLFWAVVGLFRGANKVRRWASAEEGNWELRQAAATRDDAKEWRALDTIRERQARWRWCVVLAGVLVLVGGLAVVWSPLAPWWWRWIAVAAAVPVLARVGRDADKPILIRVEKGERYIRLRADRVRAALVACGCGVKDPASVKFERDIFRDPPGQTAIVNLPDGVIATDVIDKRVYLAGALRLPTSQVWPSTVDGQHPGQLQIWVADRPLSDMRAPAWPLLDESATVDYWRPFVYGFDERMRPVMHQLEQKNTLAGGIPGSGKSLAVRVIVLAAILDPLVIPVVFELKGTGDFDAVEPLCPKGLYGSGADEDTKKAAAAGLEWLLEECERRGPIVKEHVRRMGLPQNKVTRAMAEADPRVRPIVATFDEIQELFTDKALGKRAVFCATAVVKRGRALGIHLILATQRIDKESVPRGISSNVGIRLCLAVTSHVECDLVLGTGAYSRGARPTEFETARDDDPKDSGWAWRAGLGKTSPVRSVYGDNATAKAIVARAMALRSGTPAAEPVRVNLRNLLADVDQVWTVGDDAIWSETIVPRLADLDLGAYGDWTVEIFGAAMKAAGAPTVSIGRRIDGKATTRYGVRRKALDDGLKARQNTETDDD